MVTPKKPEFRSSKEAAKWLGTQLGTKGSSALDPALAGLAASGGIPKAQAKRMSKELQNKADAQFKKLQKGLVDGLDLKFKEQGKTFKKDIIVTLEKELRSREKSDAQRMAVSTAVERRKKEAADKKDWEKKQKINQVAIAKVSEQINKEMKLVKNDTDKKRLAEAKKDYEKLQKLFASEKTKTTESRIAKLQDQIDKNLNAMKTKKSTERVGLALENALSRAETLQDKLEERYKKRENELADMSDKFDDFKTGLMKKVGVGAFNLHNILNLKKNVGNKIKGVKSFVKNAKDVRSYRKSAKSKDKDGHLRGGDVSGYRGGLPGATSGGGLASSLASMVHPEAAPTDSTPLAIPGLSSGDESQAQDQSSSATADYRAAVIANLKKLVEKSGKGADKDTGADALGKSLDGVGKGIGDVVGSLGGTLKSFGGSLVSMALPAIGIGVAAMVGTAIGTYINDKFGDKISGAVNKVAGWLGGHDYDQEAKDMTKDSADEFAKARAARDARKKNAAAGAPTAATPASTSAVPPTAPDAAGGAGTPASAAKSSVASAAISSTSGSDSGAASPSTAAVSSSPASSAPPSGDMESQKGKLYKTNGDVDVSGVNGGVAKNFLGMAQDYKDATGKTISVNSAFRDNDKQKELYDENVKNGSPKKVAKPGTSLHNYGFALDVNSSDGNALDQKGLLDKWGFSRPVQGEPWHIQPSGISLAAAKQGIYSADLSTDQGGGTKGSSVTTTGGGNASPIGDTFTPPPNPKNEPSDTSSSQLASNGKSGGAGGPSTAVGVNDVPVFSTVDGTLLAMNVGAIGA